MSCTNEAFNSIDSNMKSSCCGVNQLLRPKVKACGPIHVLRDLQADSSIVVGGMYSTRFYFMILFLC